MNNPRHKFNKGDLIWQKTRGYGIVLKVSRTKHEVNDLVGACDYVVVQYADPNTHQAQYFRNSLGWTTTEIRTKAE